MRGWVNWRELEKNNDWGVRGKNDATADLWNRDAAGWDKRRENEAEHNAKQVAQMHFSPEDTVLDICCGPGSLSVLIAPQVKTLYALDYSVEMLEFVKKNAAAAGINNIECLQGNWNSMQEGIDFSKADIAVTRHSPAHGDILKMSRAATKYCYSVWECAAHKPSRLEKEQRSRYWIASDNMAENSKPRPDARLYGFNIHFNLLYDLGANPSITYAVSELVEKAESLEAIRDKILPFREGMTEEFYQEAWARMSAGITREESGLYVYRKVRKTSVLGWDPNDIHWEDV